MTDEQLKAMLEEALGWKKSYERVHYESMCRGDDNNSKVFAVSANVATMIASVIQAAIDAKVPS